MIIINDPVVTMNRYQTSGRPFELTENVSDRNFYQISLIAFVCCFMPEREIQGKKEYKKTGQLP